MSFVMGGNEILREYRTAANKKTQLRILAELNACTRAEIADFLITCGESVDKRWLNGGSRKASTHTHTAGGGRWRRRICGRSIAGCCAGRCVRRNGWPSGFSDAGYIERRGRVGSIRNGYAGRSISAC